MAQFFRIHSQDPQLRLIKQAVTIIREGGIIVYPTDSCYALGCQPGDKEALERLRKIRQLDIHHNMTMICPDLSNISQYARLDNTSFRLIKSLTPGPYTFLLKASRDVPRSLQHPRRRTIGLRVPDNNIIVAILETLGGPLLNTSLIMPGDDLPQTDPENIRELLETRVDLIIDGGIGDIEATSMVDLVDGYPRIVREGKGDLSKIGV